MVDLARPNKQSNRTTDPLVSPVGASELADFLGLEWDPDDEDFLNGFLLTACEHYIACSNNELLQREYRLRFDRFPELTQGRGMLGTIPAMLAWWIEVPLTPIEAPTLITADGVDITQETTTDVHTKPPRIVFNNRHQKNIEITYKAGVILADDIPESVLHGILMMAAYLYEHRGECDVEDAAMKSGAKSTWGIQNMVLSL